MHIREGLRGWSCLKMVKELELPRGAVQGRQFSGIQGRVSGIPRYRSARVKSGAAAAAFLPSQTPTVGPLRRRLSFPVPPRSPQRLSDRWDPRKTPASFFWVPRLRANTCSALHLLSFSVMGAERVG